MLKEFYGLNGLLRVLWIFPVSVDALKLRTHTEPNGTKRILLYITHPAILLWTKRQCLTWWLNAIYFLLRGTVIQPDELFYYFCTVGQSCSSKTQKINSINHFTLSTTALRTRTDSPNSTNFSGLYGLLRTQTESCSKSFSNLCGRLKLRNHTDTNGTKRIPFHFTHSDHILADNTAVHNMMVKCNLFFAGGDGFSSGSTF
mgnify:CR=1 FL=1